MYVIEAPNSIKVREINQDLSIFAIINETQDSNRPIPYLQRPYSRGKLQEWMGVGGDPQGLGVCGEERGEGEGDGGGGSGCG